MNVRIFSRHNTNLNIEFSFDALQMLMFFEKTERDQRLMLNIKFFFSLKKRKIILDGRHRSNIFSIRLVHKYGAMQMYGF